MEPCGLIEYRQRKHSDDTYERALTERVTQIMVFHVAYFFPLKKVL